MEGLELLKPHSLFEQVLGYRIVDVERLKEVGI